VCFCCFWRCRQEKQEPLVQLIKVAPLPLFNFEISLYILQFCKKMRTKSETTKKLKKAGNICHSDWALMRSCPCSSLRFEHVALFVFQLALHSFSSPFLWYTYDTHVFTLHYSTNSIVVFLLNSISIVFCIFFNF